VEGVGRDCRGCLAGRAGDARRAGRGDDLSPGWLEARAAAVDRPQGAVHRAEIAKRKGSRRLKTIHPEQLQLALEGKIASVFGYSFILTDIHWQPAVWIEHYHRHRAQIEERLKDSKLDQALRHPPSGDEHANRVWLTSALLALNLTAFCRDLCPAAGASGKAPNRAPIRRAAKTLRNLLFTIPARIVRTGRRVILRPSAGFRHRHTLQGTLDAIYALGP
jgi:DDE family transposase